MGRSPCCSKEGLKRGPWSAKEDSFLSNYIPHPGEGQWRPLPNKAGLLRCGKSCRLRWMNYLKPGLKRGEFTSEEAELVKKLHRQLGNRWSAIAAQMPGRTDNEVKNFWHTHFNKGRRTKTTTSSSAAKSIKQSQETKSPYASEISFSDGLKLEGYETSWSSSPSSSSSSSPSEVYILDTSSSHGNSSSSSNSEVSEAADNWDMNSLMNRICPEMQLAETSDSLEYIWDDSATASSSSYSFPGLILQESFMLDTSYMEEFDFPLFDSSWD